MAEVIRGTIYNRERAKQLNDFSGLRWFNITPTDIDGFIDFGNKFFVLIELKFQDADFPQGQKLAIERAVDALELSGKHALAIIARHSTPIDSDVDAEKCLVTKLRLCKCWIPITETNTVKEIIDSFLKVYAPEYLAR